MPDFPKKATSFLDSLVQAEFNAPHDLKSVPYWIFHHTGKGTFTKLLQVIIKITLTKVIIWTFDFQNHLSVDSNTAKHQVRSYLSNYLMYLHQTWCKVPLDLTQLESFDHGGGGGECHNK